MYQTLWNSINKQVKNSHAAATFLAVSLISWTTIGLLTGFLICMIGGMILSRLVDTFFSRISPTMQLPPKHHSIAYVLPWAEGLHWQSRSSGCSNS